MTLGEAQEMLRNTADFTRRRKIQKAMYFICEKSFFADNIASMCELYIESIVPGSEIYINVNVQLKVVSRMGEVVFETV